MDKSLEELQAEVERLIDKNSAKRNLLAENDVYINKLSTNLAGKDRTIEVLLYGYVAVFIAGFSIAAAIFYD